MRQDWDIEILRVLSKLLLLSLSTVLDNRKGGRTITITDSSTTPILCHFNVNNL